MASGSGENELCMPEWKKELLVRRRVLTRALTSGAGVVKLRVSCPSSVPLVQANGKHLHWTSPLTDFLPDRFVGSNMRFLQPDLAPSQLINCNTNSDSDLKVKMVEEKPDKKTSFRSMEKSKESKNTKAFIKNKQKTDDEDYHSDSSEELQYGPGIVNKLKSKYLSMTLRDNQKHSARPSLSNLRRATSLENMLDDDANRLQQKPHFIKKPYHSSTHRSSKISQHHAKYLGLTRGSESMKRARSMDTLLKNDSKNGLNQMNNSPLSNSCYSNGSITPSIINEDLIIVDNSTEATDENKHPVKTENTELPPHDLVKQTLKIFETTSTKKPSEVKSKVKIAVSKITNSTSLRSNGMDNVPSKAKLAKPTLGPKPTLTPEKRFTRPKVASPKRVFPVVSSVDKPKAPVIAPKVCSIGDRKKFPSSLMSPKVSPTTETKKIVPTPPSNPILTPPANSVPTKHESEPPVTSTPDSSNFQEGFFNFKDSERLSMSPVNSNDDVTLAEDEPKYISQKARDGISKEGMSMKFSFNDKGALSDKTHLPQPVSQATNTALIASQGDVTPVKQVAVIRPVVKNLTDQEIEKNLINKTKSIDNKVVKSDETSASDNKPQLWEKKTWQSQNTMVFNFSDRKSVPDYIENDGITLTNRRTTKECNGGVDWCDGDEDWDTSGNATACSVHFIGDNILINGRSSLKKHPRNCKLRIQFNDEATTTFEYPSEESLQEDGSSPSQTPNPLTLGGGTLSSYTPSKSSGGEKFELGVTRTPPLNFNNQEAVAPESSVKEAAKEEEDYLKPVAPDQVSTWSQETTSDILF